MIKNKLIDCYLKELSEIHEINDNYVRLYSKMHEIPFKCIREMDENRLQDAIEYREKIAKMYGVPYNPFIPASCLELLLSLAYRFASVLFAPNDPDFDGQEEIFSLFIENLGLNVYDDDNFNEKAVEKILNRWMNREYNADGTNGNIVCKPGYRKLREMDIWMQLNQTIYPNFERAEFPITHPYVD